MTDGYRRRLVTIAITGPQTGGEDADRAFADGLHDQVSVLKDWLTDPRLGDRAFEHVDLWPADQDSIRNAAWDLQLGPADVIVLYVTGHGILGRSNDHYLVARDGDEGDPGTWYPTADLLRAVWAADDAQASIIIDSCHAGAVEQALLGIEQDRNAARIVGPGLMTSAEFAERPRVRELTGLLKITHNRLRDVKGFKGEYLTYEELWGELAKDSGDWSKVPIFLRPRHHSYASEEPSLCLPNPGYEAPEEFVDPAREQVSIGKEDLDYWLSRASGRADVSDTGWYFSGRADLMRSVVGFLCDGVGTLVVTGSVGSGKSAILARAVTLSDQRFRDEHPELIEGIESDLLPPADSIDVAVLARSKSTATVVEELLGALDPPSAKAASDRSAVETLLGRLGAQPKPFTLVVDGIDEAIAPSALITDLLGPIMRLRTAAGWPVVRLLAGLRSMHSATDSEGQAEEVVGTELLSLLGRQVGENSGLHVRQVRTDERPAVTTDIAAYVTELVARQGPYSGDRAAADELARVVAEHVSPSFLNARLAGQRARDAEHRQDLDDQRWRDTLSTGTVALFSQDLLDVTRALNRPATEVLAVLRATAFTLGRGLPWAEVWPAAAGAVLGDNAAIATPDDLIRGVLRSRLSGYLTRDAEDGREVYRPNHEGLADALRMEPAALLGEAAAGHSPEVDPATVHARIAGALAALVDPDGRFAPHPYVARHLAAHAARGGLLDDRHVSPGFLPWETSGEVRGLLGLPLPTSDSTRYLAAWARVEPYLGDKDDDLARRQALSLSCAALGLSQAPITGTTPIRTRWASWDLGQPNVLSVSDSPVLALAAVQLAGEGVLLASAGADGSVRLWNPSDWQPHGQPLVGHIGPVRALATAQGPDRRTLLASGGEDGTIRLWDPATGRLRGEPLTASDRPLLALAAVSIDDGRVLIASGGHDGVVRLWDPETGREARPPIHDHIGSVRALVTLTLPGGHAILASGTGGTVRLWDPATSLPFHQQVGAQSARQGPAIRALACVMRPGDGVLLAVGDDRTIQLWDTSTGHQVDGSATGPRGPIRALAATVPRDGSAILACGKGRNIQIRRSAAGRTAIRGLTGHTGAVRALTAISRPSGDALLASGGNDGTIRLWDLATPSVVPRSDLGRVRHVGVLVAISTADRGVLLASGNGQAVRLWDATTGERVGRTLTGHTGIVRALTTITQPDGHAHLASAGDDRTIRIWDPTTGEQVGRTLTGHTGSVRALTTITQPDGHALLASAGNDHTIRLWDPTTGQPVCEHLELPLVGRAGRVVALAPAIGDDGRTLLASASGRSVRLWDLARREQVGRALVAGAGLVRALTAVEPNLLASGGQGGVRLWNTVTCEAASQSLSEQTAATWALAVLPLPDGSTLLASGGNDGSVRLWDPGTEVEIARISTHGQTLAIAAAGVSTFAIAGPAGLACFDLGRQVGRRAS